jgi:3-oxoacyl-[acyl-carrier protein] reductase
MTLPLQTKETSMSTFTGRRAVVTSGSHGIGAATVARLSILGASVAVIDIEPADAAHHSVIVDLADQQAVLAAADRAVELLGGVDVLVNCAGVNLPSPTVALDVDRYHRTLAVNLHAPVLLMRELGRHMQHGGYGRVVNVTSIHARFTEPGSLAYDVSKAGLEAATRTAAIELGADGVLVNAVAPGFVATRMSVVDGQDELESDQFQDVYVKRAGCRYGEPLNRKKWPRPSAGCPARPTPTSPDRYSPLTAGSPPGSEVKMIHRERTDRRPRHRGAPTLRVRAFGRRTLCRRDPPTGGGHMTVDDTPAAPGD